MALWRRACRLRSIPWPSPRLRRRVPIGPWALAALSPVRGDTTAAPRILRRIVPQIALRPSPLTIGTSTPWRGALWLLRVRLGAAAIQRQIQHAADRAKERQERHN